jgi:VanZ family protein
MSNSPKMKWLLWLPAIAWAIIIFCFSGRSSAPQVSHKPGVQFAIQKFGHMTEYAILAFFIRLPLRRHHKWPLRNVTFLAIVFAFLYAVSDEWHQYFIPGRTAMLADVIIDTTGATIAMLAFHLYESRRSQQPNR